MSWKENSRWSELEHYKAVVQYMFADNVVNHSRLVVLYTYTTDVCSRVSPSVSEVIWKHFKHFLRSKNITDFLRTKIEIISHWW